MNTIVCEDPMALGRAAAKWCEEKSQSLQARSIWVPAGNTPVALYRIWEAEKPSYLNDLALLQVDDVMTGSQRGIFSRFFFDHLPSYRKQIRFIDEANDVADLAVLGLGLNGHIAFHEPEMDASFFSGCVRLNPITSQHLKLEPGTWGISYGAAAFKRSRAILIMVSGASKREILARFLSGDPRLPATSLLGHDDLTILADREALHSLPFDSNHLPVSLA